MSQIAITPPTPLDRSPGEDPFRYGWRYLEVARPDGGTDWEQVPLTLEDVLHPREGDVIPENSQQERDRRYLHDVFESRYADDDGVLTLSDCLVDWGVEGLRPHSPDLSVFEGVNTKEGSWGMYRLREDGGRPLLVAEVVSPHTRQNDVDVKPEHYYRVGVPLYVLIDQKKEGGPRQLVVYRHAPGGYAEVSADTLGRVALPGGVRIAIEADRVICYDADTGQELGDYTRVSQQLEEEVSARLAAEQRADQAEAREQEQSEARLAAEAREKEQTEARLAAEAREREQAQARLEAAERRADLAEASELKHVEARLAAEVRAREHGEALIAAMERALREEDAHRITEARLRELEARLGDRDKGPA